MSFPSCSTGATFRSRQDGFPISGQSRYQTIEPVISEQVWQRLEERATVFRRQMLGHARERLCLFPWLLFIYTKSFFFRFVQ